MSDFAEADQVSQKLISVQATIFLLAVYFLSAALDVIDLLGGTSDPPAIAGFACSIRSLALVTIPSISGRSAQSLADQCLGAAREPTFSMIFFSVKMTMAILAFVVLWGFVYWRPDGFRELTDYYGKRFGEPGGYRNELRTFVKKSLGVIFFLFCCLLLASFGASEPGLKFALALKFVVEDGLAIAIPAVMLDVTAKAFLFIAFSLTHKTRR